MRYISFIKDDKVIDQRQTSMIDQEAISLFDMLQKNKVIPDNMELAITEDVQKCPYCDKELGEHCCDCCFEDGLFG